MDLKQMLDTTNRVMLAGMKAGEEIGRHDSAAMIASLEHDCMTLAMRLYCESDNTFAPETIEVMARWRPRVTALIAGNSTDWSREVQTCAEYYAVDKPDLTVVKP